MIDRTLCMAPRDRSVLGGPRCQAPATHDTVMGRRCTPHAEEMRRALRDPDTFGNLLAGARARTEEEIARMVVELPPSKPTEPGPNDGFILRIDGKVQPCDECGNNVFRRLPPRDGIDRFGCNACGAAYLFKGAEPPKLLEN